MYFLLSANSDGAEPQATAFGSINRLTVGAQKKKCRLNQLVFTKKSAYTHRMRLFKGDFYKMTFLLLLILFIIGCALYAKREMGDMPSPAELKSYESLPYFHNGTFQSIRPQEVDFKNVRNAKNNQFSFMHFFLKSKFAPDRPLPCEPLNRESFSKQPESFGFYWLGHSSVILELNGKRIFFDPVFENAAPLPLFVPRYGDSPLSLTDLPPIDLVIITHNHYDHLERKAIQALKDALFVVPLGVGSALRGWGVNPAHITELGWGESAEGDGLTITAERTSHFSGRGLADKNKTLCNSYILQSEDKRLFFAGDTGYTSHFAEIGAQYGPFDLVALEIDGWNTGWRNTHLFPHEVIQAMKDLKSINLLPVHWGVFDLAFHPWTESIEMVINEAQKTDIRLITPIMGQWADLNTETTDWWRMK